MKAHELVRELQKLDPETPVVVWSGDEERSVVGFSEVKSMSVVKMKPYAPTDQIERLYAPDYIDATDGDSVEACLVQSFE